MNSLLDPAGLHTFFCGVWVGMLIIVVGMALAEMENKP